MVRPTLAPFLVALACGLGYAQSGGPAYDQAMAQVQQGRFDDAIPALERLVAESAQDLRTRNLLGIALAGAGRREEANRQFRKVLESNPRFLPALKNIAANELELGLNAEAARHFEEALVLAPKDPLVHLGLARIDFAAGRFDRAVAHYEQTGGLYLRDPRELVRYATSCVETRQPQKAANALTELPSQTDPETHFEAGLLLARLDQYEKAARQFELARSGSADRYKVEFNLTLAYLKSRNFPAALKTAQGAISAGQRTSEIFSLLGQAHEGLGSTQEAYEALRVATQIDPKDETAYLELIALCIEHENYPLGLEIADIGVRVVPRSHRLRIQRGIVLAMAGRFAEAEKDFDISSQLAPQKTIAPIARALVLMRTDRVPEAVEDLRRRQRQDGKDYLVSWFLAEALTRMGDAAGDTSNEAIAALENSIALNPNVSQSRMLLGKLRLARGETDRAVKELEKALELDPESIPVTYQLAQAYRKRGDPRATELFAKVSQAKAESLDQLTRSGLLRIVRESSR